MEDGRDRDETSPSVVDRIVDTLSSAIVDGRLSPGQRLIERELTTELNVSRNALREAFRRLSAEGILSIEPNRGARVHRMSLTDVRNLCEIRGALEGLAARLAAERAGGEVDFKPSLRAQRRAVSGGDVVAYTGLNNQFHDLIVTAAQNAQLEELIARSQRQFARFQFQRMLANGGMRASYEEHQRIANAIGDRDGRLAEQLMIDHVQELYEYVRNLPETELLL